MRVSGLGLTMGTWPSEDLGTQGWPLLGSLTMTRWERGPGATILLLRRGFRHQNFHVNSPDFKMFQISEKHHMGQIKQPLCAYEMQRRKCPLLLLLGALLFWAPQNPRAQPWDRGGTVSSC